MNSSLKFQNADFTDQDVASLPDVPSEAGYTAAQLKARFDNIGKTMVALGKHNDLVDALTAKTAAAGIGAVEADGSTATTVQARFTDVQGALTQLSAGKAPLTGWTPSRVMVSNSSGQMVASGVSNVQLNYINNLSSDAQTQIDAKADDMVSQVKYRMSRAMSPTQYDTLANQSVEYALNWLAEEAADALLGMLGSAVLQQDDGETYWIAGSGTAKTLFQFWLDKLTARINARQTETASLQTQVDAKQDTLTFDDAPTDDSSNPVTSGGVYDAIHAAATREKPAGTYTAGGTKTLALADAGKWFSCYTENVNVYIPLNADVAFPVGTEIDFCRFGEESVEFSCDAGANLFSAGSGLEILHRYGVAHLKKTGTNTWVLYGDV